jgi:predicted metalloendopeptidase
LEKGAEGYMDVYLTDVHSPGCIRATGNVFMADEFYEAFGITDGKQYVTPKKRIHIW